MDKFKQSKLEITVILPPKYSSDPLKGVCNYLNKYLLKYNAQVEGFVLSYQNIKFQSKMGEFLLDSPWIKFKVECDFLVFAPEIGSRMSGHVSKQSNEYISLILYGTFHVIIHKDSIPTKYVFQTLDQEEYDKRKTSYVGQWCSLDKILEEGSLVEFKVIKLIRMEQVSIVGELY